MRGRNGSVGTIAGLRSYCTLTGDYQESARTRTRKGVQNCADLQNIPSDPSICPVFNWVLTVNTGVLPSMAHISEVPSHRIDMESRNYQGNSPFHIRIPNISNISTSEWNSNCSRTPLLSSVIAKPPISRLSTSVEPPTRPSLHHPQLRRAREGHPTFSKSRSTPPQSKNTPD